MNGWIGRVYEYLATYGLRVLAAAVILVVGWWAARYISRLLNKTLIKGKVDKTLANFCRNLCYVIILVFVAIAALNKLGVETTSFAVVVGAVALAIGFALQTVCELAESSVNFAVRPWAKTDDYWQVYFEVTEQIKIDLDRNEISIPYPQRDVHMVKEHAHAAH